MKITTALAEWEACCRILGDGRVLLTARKGGIHEVAGGLFAPEHPRFLLLPTREHQAGDRLHPGYAAEVLAPSDQPPGRRRIALWAEVARAWKAEDLMAIQALGPELPFSPAELEKRFRYRGQPFLHLLALRVHRLPAPIDIPDLPAYAGCRSWLELQTAIDTEGSVPVLPIGRFEARLERIAETIGRPRGIIPH